jgi:hypothetical protein
MTTMRGKVGLDMRHRVGSACETKGESSRRMNEFFRNIRAEETDGDTFPGKGGGDLTMSPRSDYLEFF